MKLLSVFLILISIFSANSVEGELTQKLCNHAHKNKVLFLCTRDNIICCEECAIKYHPDHIEELETLSSVFLKLKMKAKTMKNSKNADSTQMRKVVKERLRNTYDEYIRKVVEYKEEWIEENLQIIMNKEKKETKPMDSLIEKIEEAYRTVHNIESSVQEYTRFRFPEELEKELESIKEKSKSKYGDLKIDLTFDKKSLKQEMNWSKQNKQREPMFKDIEWYIKEEEDIPFQSRNEYGNDSRESENKNSLYLKYEGININKEEFENLFSLLPQQVIDIKLLFSSKVDGVDGYDFHAKCDGKSQTLVIIKEKDGKVFGGYASPPWYIYIYIYIYYYLNLFRTNGRTYSTGECIKDPTTKSFLFSIKPKILKLPLTNKSCALFGHIISGPTFGKLDLQLHSNYLTEAQQKKYYSSLSKLSDAGETIVWGTHNIDNYEVYQLIFS